MTKKLLPAVIGMILAGGVAVVQADVQVMGHIDESINYINGGKYTATIHVNNTISRRMSPGAIPTPNWSAPPAPSASKDQKIWATA